jgi:hypothetical protein
VEDPGVRGLILYFRHFPEKKMAFFFVMVNFCGNKKQHFGTQSSILWAKILWKS